LAFYRRPPRLRRVCCEHVKSNTGHFALWSHKNHPPMMLHPGGSMRRAAAPQLCRRPCIKSLSLRAVLQRRKHGSSSRSQRVAALTSSTEQLIAQLLSESPESGDEEDAPGLASATAQMRTRLSELEQQVHALDAEIDQAYASCFSGLTVSETDTPGTGAEHLRSFEGLTEAVFAALGRDEPVVMEALLREKQEQDPAGWTQFQQQVRQLKLRRTRAAREAQDLAQALTSSQQQQAGRSERASRLTSQPPHPAAAPAPPTPPPTTTAPGWPWGLNLGFGGGPPAVGVEPLTRPVRIVLVSGFESFNVDLYKQAARQIKAVLPSVSLAVFSDRDLAANRQRVADALAGADIFFASLLFDYDQVEWLRGAAAQVPVRLVFESALELMSLTQVGGFNMAPGAGGEKRGPPPVVKKLLSLFGSQREEDKMVGYLAFLKVGPALLKWVPGKQAGDLRTWLTTYSYWNQGGLTNVVSMFLYLINAVIAPLPASLTSPAAAPSGAPGGHGAAAGGAGRTVGAAAAAAVMSAPVETPSLGCLHPLYAEGQAYFASPADYMRWYSQHGPLRGTGAPVVGVLLYRKHVITQQQYIPQLITLMEQEGVLPLPIFINGVEAHTVVRDLLTSRSEQQALARGVTGGISPTLSRDAVPVDAVVSTIGFPLVGGPAGSMEGGRQADVAKAILTSKNVPYIVAAPLLIQDMGSWTRDGIAGLQSVVLYSLPELDGAIDTVPLGGLVGDAIYLVPERVKKMAGRIRAWVSLRRKAAHERRVAVLLYGFPPGVGATGTAALLNVPKSLQALLAALKSEGYDLGHLDLAAFDGEQLVAALSGQAEQRAVSRGASGVNALGVGPAADWGLRPGAAEVDSQQLKAWLSYPADWGPTDWGPIPFLPDNDILVQRLERQWGNLRSYRGLACSAAGNLVVPGVTAGKVFVGVQPLLGLEGDPMRLLFERDLTPHPQYAAFYKWLQHEFKADVVLHFGMHGTVEWLPGAPLGNTGFSWSDVMLGDMPNVYVYAANNPSESIIAKRRGYGTIVSHNVPPYGRAGLYKQLSTLKELIAEDRETRNTQQQRQQQQQQAGVGTASSAASPAAAAPPVGVRGTGDAAGAGAAAVSEAGMSSLRGAILENMRLAGLASDVPFFPATNSPLHPPPHPTAPSSPSHVSSRQPASHASQLQEVDSIAYSSSSSQRRAALRQAGGSRPKGPAAGMASSLPPGAVELTPENVQLLSEEEWGQYMSHVYSYLQTLENRLFSEGLHVLGSPPTRTAMVQYLSAYYDGSLPDEAVEEVAAAGPGEGVDQILQRLKRQTSLGGSSSSSRLGQVQGQGQGQGQGQVWDAASLEALAPKLEEAVRIRDLLQRNTEELRSVVRALGGEYIEPEAGGDLLRDGAGVLPTGRNIHALDPYRMPSPAAMERGAALAEAIIQQHREANEGAYPETVAVNLWGLDAIKTKGESVGIALALVGARPLKEATGRVARYELLPLAELGGRPRIDVLCNMSGIFRDSFQNVVELLDDLFQRAAAAPEPPSLNFVAKHAQAIAAKGLDNSAARLFSNPAGDYGSMVNERVGTGAWEGGDELGDTWAARNAFSYGRGQERGAARPEVLSALLASTDRVVQEIDSVEYGLTDIQEYYANTGALKRAATVARGGRPVSVSVVEAFGKDTTPRELEQVLRLEYRSKLLNPRWAQAMAAQGSGGAYEISQRMTAMVGWAATAGFSEKFVWDQAAATYALDPEMADKLKSANPQAFANVLRRMLEAAGRGMWTPDEQVLAALKEQYSEMDDQLEGVTGPKAAGKRTAEQQDQEQARPTAVTVS
ncbi:CobN/Magnesium chelatase-domain-containing protein, partial [Haematococcus lacustris]